MSIRIIKFTRGEYYHIYNRGNSKQVIFKDKNDHNRFIKLLFLCNSVKHIDIREIGKDVFKFRRNDTLVSIGAWVLMPNHFHLILTENIEGGISKFMQKITTAYSMYFNNKYKRTGSLFEGKFKSQHLDSDRYLKYLFSYIHLNPIKLIQNDWKEKGIKNKNDAIKFLEKYEYSSYLDFFRGNRYQVNILNFDSFPKYFSNKNSFNKEIFEWLSYGRQDLPYGGR